MLDQWIIDNADDLQIVLFLTLLGIFAVVEMLVPRRTSDMRRRRRWAVAAEISGESPPR
jgi:hypothetical protein